MFLIYFNNIFQNAPSTGEIIDRFNLNESPVVWFLIGRKMESVIVVEKHRFDVENPYEALYVFLSAFSMFHINWSKLSYCKTLEVLHRVLLTNFNIAAPTKSVRALINNLKNYFFDSTLFPGRKIILNK